MKDTFTEYLRSIGIPTALHKRIETILEFYQKISPDEITGIFVTDYVKEHGEREYENLWFFSEKHVMEARQFTIKDDFDITPVQDRICHWRIQKQDYDVKRATEKSRLYLQFVLDTGVSGDLKASKENCDYLWDIVRKYLLPNLKE